jgi:hypothetical protein
MASAAGAAGFGTGLRAGLATARQRRLEEEDRKIQAEDRVRRREHEDVSLEGSRLTLERARRADQREPEDLDYQRRSREQQLASGDIGIESGQLGLESARRSAGREEEEITRRRGREDLDTEARQFDLSRSRTQAGREDAGHAQNQQSVATAGFSSLFSGIKEGVSQPLLLQRFNDRVPPEMEVAEIEHNPDDDTYTLVSASGHRSAAASIDDWLKAYPMPAGELEKLGKDDRLVDPQTGRTVVGAADGGDGGGRDTSPYNPETVGNHLRGDIVRSAGGQLGPLGEIMGIADPEARRLVDFQIAEATAMEGRLRQHVSAGRIGTGQISQAVLEATRGIPSETELARRAETWRTRGWDKSQQEAADWLAIERTKAQTEAAQKLATAEQHLIGEVARPAFTEKPSWAGEVVQGVDPSQLEAGYEYDVEIDGKPATIRLGPDGQVYEIGGSPQASNRTGRGRNTSSRATANRMAGDSPEVAQVNATLADARRNSQEFLY